MIFSDIIIFWLDDEVIKIVEEWECNKYANNL